jgi:nitrogen fixation/metabolism regulation signal transduction histidine kinase
MKLSTKFIAYIAIIHLLAIGLSFYIFKKEPLFFIASEVFVLLSFFIAWQLYQSLIQPLNLLMTGVEAIKDRDFNVKFLKTGKYEMDRLIAIYNQMIDQLRTERTQQQEQHYFLEKLVNTSPTGILMLDFDENITQLNPKAQEMLGIDAESVLQRPLASMAHPVLQALSQLKTGDSRTITFNGVETFKCQKAHFMDRGFPRYFVMLEELTAEILAAEKNAYGKVIRLMAHEVNNSIGAVNSILDSALHYLDQSPDVQNAVEVAIERNDHLNHFMRNFADIVRLPAPQKEQLNMNELVQNIARLMEFNARQRDINFVFELSPEPVWAQADRRQMEQVLVNVVKNALESIGKKGTITFKTTAVPAQLEIIDTGTGIAPEIADQLFSPFFSTKKNGQGVGLTLVREILVNHDFGVSLRTEREGKTVFRVGF